MSAQMNQNSALDTFTKLILAPWLTGAAPFLQAAEKPLVQALAQAQLDFLASQPDPLSPAKIIAVHDLLVSFLFAYRADMKALQEGGVIPKAHERLRKVIKEPARRPRKSATITPEQLQKPDLPPVEPVKPDKSAPIAQQPPNVTPLTQPASQIPTPPRSAFLRPHPTGKYHERIGQL